eukprot:CAMPEP_0170548060 /NCGR_PEP_ID=MMETSP0211-20121228/6380_1 /TAXON_ID=311385 /ORGANISM="Pseudokeronopsis sp., Strain OXSARD2" /LENGTH=185 /DNA_ID=CAMNT_0010853377 /DNA_START=1330 /DNA_END=1887 /DNA_ORIENTATION=+
MVPVNYPHPKNKLMGKNLVSDKSTCSNSNNTTQSLLKRQEFKSLRMADYFKDQDQKTDIELQQQDIQLGELTQDLRNKILFAEGENLQEGLIDLDKTFSFVNKLRDVNKEKNQENFQNIFQVFDAKNVNRDKKSIFRQQRNWNEVITFMKEHPQLLLNMIPNSSEPGASEWKTMSNKDRFSSIQD